VEFENSWHQHLFQPEVTHETPGNHRIAEGTAGNGKHVAASPRSTGHNEGGTKTVNDTDKAEMVALRLEKAHTALREAN
jgi:hypothetical protein